MKKETTAKIDETKTVVAAPKAKTPETKAETKTEKKVETKSEKTKTVKKTENTKTTAKKVAKAELKAEVFIQYQGKESVVADAIEKAKAAFVADGHRESSIKSLQIYLKPEEYAAYYVINKKFAGRVDLF